jgi:hypothetical protein
MLGWYRAAARDPWFRVIKRWPHFEKLPFGNARGVNTPRSSDARIVPCGVV